MQHLLTKKVTKYHCLCQTSVLLANTYSVPLSIKLNVAGYVFQIRGPATTKDLPWCHPAEF